MEKDKPSHLVRWIGPMVIFGIILLIIVLLLPALQQAREAARRTQSKNNLKQIGLALKDYHDVFNKFPPGGVFSADGTAFHGWTTLITPFLNASQFYSEIDFDIPWEDPRQLERFLDAKYPVFLNPSREPTQSPDGLPLVHYSANQWLLHRNSSVSIRDIETRTSNTVVVGDALGDFTPFGYPYNWRDPLIPMNSSIEGFGYNYSGTQVLLVDGTVKWVDKDIDADVQVSFCGPETLRPSAASVEKPKQLYRVSNQKMWTTVILYSNRETRWILEGRKNPDGQLISVRFRSTEKVPQDVKYPLDEAISSLKGHDSIESFSGTALISDAGLKILAGCPNLQFLAVGSQWITDDGLKSVSMLTNLRELTISRSPITDLGIRHLRQLSRMRTLNLFAEHLGDDGIAAIAGLATLEKLEIGQADLRGGRLHAIANLPRLVSLTLRDVEITDEELKVLHPTPTLRTLTFEWVCKEPQLTSGAVSGLQEAIPRTKVVTRDVILIGSGRTRHAPSVEIPTDATQPINVPRQTTNADN